MLVHSFSRTVRRPFSPNLTYAIRQSTRSFTDPSVSPPNNTESTTEESAENYRVVPITTIRKVKVEHSPSSYGKWFRKKAKRKMSNSSGPPFNDLTYYTFGTPNGLKPAIVLEELGLHYKVVPIDITKNTQKEDWFLEINPNGRIPALKDGDMRIFESGAIMLYLADHYDTSEKITYKHGTPLYYEMLSWLMFQMGGIGPMQGQANHFRVMAGARSDYGIKRYIDETKRLYSVLELRLSKADWLAGDRYTIADIANYSWVRAGPVLLDIDLGEWPGVDRWVKRIDARPAVEKAKNVPPRRMTPEEVKEMFAKMRARIDAMENTDKH